MLVLQKLFRGEKMKSLENVKKWLKEIDFSWVQIDNVSNLANMQGNFEEFLEIMEFSNYNTIEDTDYLKYFVKYGVKLMFFYKLSDAIEYIECNWQIEKEPPSIELGIKYSKNYELPKAEYKTFDEWQKVN